STPLSPPPRPPLFPYTTLFRSVLPSRWLRVRVPLAAPHTSVRHALAQRHTVYPRAVCQIARVEGRTQPGYPETRYTIVRRPYVVAKRREGRKPGPTERKRRYVDAGAVHPCGELSGPRLGVRRAVTTVDPRKR